MAVSPDPTSSPTPRRGLPGEWDKYVGPGAARWEVAGTIGSALVGALGAPGLVAGARPAARALELAVASRVGADVAAGAWCNETPSRKRWIHRPGSSRLGRVGYTALQIHPFVVEASSGRRDFRAAAVSYGMLVASSAILEAVPLERRRSVATVLYTTWLASTSVVAPPPPGYAWLPPLLGLKSLIGQGTPRGPLSRLGRGREER